MTKSVISDFSKKTYLAYEKLKGVLAKHLGNTEGEIQSIILQLEENQRVAQERLRDLVDTAVNLNKELLREDREKLDACRNNISKFLENMGIDPVCIDQFFQDPSPENLEQLKKQFPKK